jgi:hypothetical protein
MEGFDLELKHGIILAYHGKPLYHLAEMLVEIKRHAREGQTKMPIATQAATVRLDATHRSSADSRPVARPDERNAPVVEGSSGLKDQGSADALAAVGDDESAG